TEGAPEYFLKAKHGSFYEPGSLVARYLADQGIAAVVAPIPTMVEHALWVTLGEWTLSLYPFIEGEATWDPGPSDASWREVGAAFRRIHGTPLPRDSFGSLRAETFDPTHYLVSARDLEARYLLSDSGSEPARDLRSCWIANRIAIHEVAAAMAKLAPVLRGRS